jgi:lipopolysaccharide/colanic/teichoic acid biosynthesis glycosyltransferase
MKRLFDIVVSACALLVLALPLWVLMWQVRRKLGSPVFFTQVRPGLHGKPFKMVKFRSMTSERGADGELLPDAVRLTPVERAQGRHEPGRAAPAAGGIPAALQPRAGPPP